jgi:hypothetical protein
MGEEDFADFVAAIEEDRRRYENNLFTSEYAMEVPRDTIYYIKPCFSDKVTLSFSFKPKYKRVCKI